MPLPSGPVPGNSSASGTSSSDSQYAAGYTAAASRGVPAAAAVSRRSCPGSALTGVESTRP